MNFDVGVIVHLVGAAVRVVLKLSGSFTDTVNRSCRIRHCYSKICRCRLSYYLSLPFTDLLCAICSRRTLIYLLNFENLEKLLVLLPFCYFYILCVVCRSINCYFRY